MTTASSGSLVYTNSDGLRLRFGTDQAKKALQGSPAQSGPYKQYEFDIVYNRMAAFGTNLILGEIPQAALPAGMLVKEAILTTVVAFDSAADALTLSIGLCKQDGTVIDDDGIDSAIAQAAIDAVGESVTCDGALIGTVLAYDSYITVLANTATATAGQAKLILKLLPISDLS